MEANRDDTTVLDQALDAVTEKRGSTREEGWAKLNRGLALHYSSEWLDKRRETVTEALLHSIKKGSEKEASLALRGLALVAVTLGSEADSLHAPFSELLHTLAKDDTKVGLLRSEALDALTAIAFVTNAHVEALMDFCHTFKRSAISEAALRNWGVLATLRDVSDHEKIYTDMMPDLALLLDHNDLDVRLAAGEDIAYLVEVERSVASEEEAPFSLDDLYPDVVSMPEVLEKLQDLSADRSRYQSKDKVLKQRSGFREIVNSVEEGDFEPTVLAINRSTVHFDNWAQLKRLNFFRAILGEGIQEHFIENELLHEVFEANIPTEAGKNPFSGVGKRMFLSPNSATSKERTRQMAKNRALAHSTDE